MNEESMNSEERVKLIKWGCKYAEKYCIDNRWGVFAYDTGSAGIIFSVLCEKWLYEILYRDFIQQVIEGINKKWVEDDNGFAIYQHQEGITIYFAYHIQKSFNFSDFQSIAETKETALIYIMGEEIV